MNTAQTNEFDTERMLDWIHTQVAFGPRRPGTTAGQQNEDFLAGELEALGLEQVRKEPIGVARWETDAVALEVGSRGELEKIDCFPIPYCAFTPQEGLSAPLTFFEPSGPRSGAPVKGRIVVADIRFPPLDTSLLTRIAAGVYDPGESLAEASHPATWVRLGWHLYRLAEKLGAVGFIGILEDQPGGSCRMYAPYGFREKDILDKPLPGLWVGREAGARLRDLTKSERGEARLILTGERAPSVTHNVIGEIPGRRDDEVFVLSCHHDSPFASPVEDASGVAVVLAMAEHFAKERGLNRRIIVVLTAGHFYGSIGTRSFIRDHRVDVVRRTALEMTIEHVALEAVEDATGELVPTGQPEATGVFVPFSQAVTKTVMEGVRAHDLRRVVLLPAEGPLGDFPPTDGGDWWEAGVPVINCICNPIYLLTDDDAMKWVDRDRLAPLAATFTDVLRELDRMPRETIAARDKPLYRLAMAGLKHVSRARTTRLGTRPVY